MGKSDAGFNCFHSSGGRRCSSPALRCPVCGSVARLCHKADGQKSALIHLIRKVAQLTLPRVFPIFPSSFPTIWMQSASHQQSFQTQQADVLSSDQLPVTADRLTPRLTGAKVEKNETHPAGATDAGDTKSELKEEVKHQTYIRHTNANAALCLLDVLTTYCRDAQWAKRAGSH